MQVVGILELVLSIFNDIFLMGDCSFIVYIIIRLLQ